MIRWQLSPEAVADLDEIFDQGSAAWGEPRAIAYLRAIEAVLATATERPARWPAAAFAGRGVRRAKAGRHHIYFRATIAGLEVIRILDERRNAPRHF